MGDPFFFAILQEDWHFGQSTEDARRRLFMSQVVVWSSLVRTCVIRSLKVQDRGVDERTGGGAGAAGGGGAVGGAVGAVGRFDPFVYLNTRYRTPGAQDNERANFTLKNLHEAIKLISSHLSQQDNIRVLDYGCGPVVCNIISAAGLPGVSECSSRAHREKSLGNSAVARQRPFSL